MSFQYVWKNKEANFGKPLRKQVGGGTHITCEIVLKRRNKYIGLRRSSIPGHEAPPKTDKNSKGFLYFCHNLIRYGEPIDKCVKRIVKSQAGVYVKDYKITDIETEIQKKDNQWAITIYVIAELSQKPKVGLWGNKITEVVEFNKNNIPNDFAWWSKNDLSDFLKKL